MYVFSFYKSSFCLYKIFQFFKTWKFIHFSIITLPNISLTAFLDIDECSGDNDCHDDANCTDTVGSYICSCNEGYTGNGINCDGKSFVIVLEVRELLNVGLLSDLTAEINTVA